MTDRDELTEVFSTSSVHEAEILRLALNAEGIACEIGGGSQAGLAGIGIMEVKLLVRAADEQKARSYLTKMGDKP